MCMFTYAYECKGCGKKKFTPKIFSIFEAMTWNFKRLENFALKFQAVTEKTAKKILGETFLLHSIHVCLFAIFPLSLSMHPIA